MIKKIVFGLICFFLPANGKPNINETLFVQDALQTLHTIYEFKFLQQARVLQKPEVADIETLFREARINTPADLYELAIRKEVCKINNRIYGAKNHLWSQFFSDLSQIKVLCAAIIFAPEEFHAADRIALIFDGGICSYENFSLAILSVGVSGLLERKHKLEIAKSDKAADYVLNRDLAALIKSLGNNLQKIYKKRSSKNIKAFFELDAQFKRIDINTIQNDDYDTSEFRTTRYIFYTLWAAYIGACAALL